MRTLLWIVCFVATAALPATARADGIAFAGVKDGGDGIASPDASVRYVTLPLPDQTVVAKVRADGSVIAHRPLPDSWGIPMVAFDGSTGGLSADGRVLVLAQPPIGRMREVSRFPVLHTGSLRSVRTVTLAGSFSFDAVSPDGSTLYLIEHVNRDDVAEYRVRAYDLARNRLLPRPIRDARSNETEMYGYPMSRATSADGRWAYTLYQGGHHSFVHALDTVERKAVCIDLPHETRPDHVARARLVLGRGGDTLAVNSAAGGRLAVVDLEKLALRPAQGDRPPAAPAPTEDEESVGWLLLAGPFAAVLLTAGVCARRMRRLPADAQGSERAGDAARP